MMTEGFEHTPVMLPECLAALAVRGDGVYLDGTAGGGGHSRAIAQRLTTGHLYALDRDPDAVAAASAALAGLNASVHCANFCEAGRVLAENGARDLDGALLDLGVSSHQLDSAGRGFSYHADAPLDMRMSQSGPAAAELVNTLSREELARILREYGEESHAWAVAGKIVQQRQKAPIETTNQLADTIFAALPAAVRRKAKNPARKSFQAIRIAVNGELDALDVGLDGIFALLRPGGRLAVLTFHSLEDRMVKQRFRAWATACTCPPDFPVCVCKGRARAKLVGKNPLPPSEEEQAQNRRSRSAKLRCIEKL